MEGLKNELFKFLDESTTAYHAVANIAAALDAAGYVRLYEDDAWALEDKKGYYVIRDGSSVIAFRNGGGSFMIGAAHSDSPAFRVKSVSGNSRYVRLSTEKYGGLINYTWLDRPLAISGRVTVKENGGIRIRLVSLPGTVLIPSLAIHLNRGVNDGAKLSLTSDMIPLASLAASGAPTLEALTAMALGLNEEDIISHELYLTAADKAAAVGLAGELVLSPRLDDLSAVWASLSAFLTAPVAEGTTPVLAVFDNEEVGSETKQGAASTFLYDTLVRISGGEDEYRRRIASSFMVSADNAHAIHPNHPELSDAENAPVLGGGVVIKYNANQRYTTDAVSDAILRTLAQRAGVRVQTYFNRADMPGGSTLGSIADTKVPVATVDIGIPQLAMHSANESCAIADVFEARSLMAQLFGSRLCRHGDDITLV